MEGGSLSVCPDCAESCYRIHGKAGSRRGSYFFKVLLGDFAKTLRIPPAFVAQLRNQAHSDAILEGPSGQRWVVKLRCSSMGMNFEDGWAKFVSDHLLELGDFLVFRHVHNSHFMVQIFGRSGCEKKNVFNIKNSTDAGKETVSCVPQMIILHANEDLNDQVMASSNLKQSLAEASASLACAVNEDKPSCCGSDIHPLKNIEHAMPSFTRKKERMLQSANNGVRNYVQTYFVSCRRPVTQTERDKALKAASSFKSSKPSSFLVMKHSHVYQGFWLGFPVRFLKLFKLPKKRIEVTLLGPTNKEYVVAYLGDRSNAGLSGGWRYFALDNNLEEGDVCIFELVNKTKYIFKVYIFRVVEKCIPLKKIEGTRISNENKRSVPAATNHFKMIKGGTNSEKDIVGTLAAEKNGNHFSHIQEHITSAKQVIKHVYKKKGYPNSGSNNTVCGITIIADSEAGCESSPRYATGQNLVEHLKTCVALTDAPKSITMEIGDLSSEPCISVVDISEEPALAVGLDVSSMANMIPPNISTSDLIPSQDLVCKGPFTVNSTPQVVNQNTQAVKLDLISEDLEVNPIH